MKKRIIVTLLMLAMLCTIFVGCESSSESPSESTVSGNSAEGDFPNDTITIIVPWGVGGGADVISRKFAQVAEKYIDQPIVVENHTGASGTIGMADAFEKKADGYTIVVANGPLFTLIPRYANTNYRLEDFTPLKGVRTVSLMLLVNPEKSGLESYEDLIEYGETNKIKYATSSGPGSDQYVLATAAFKTLGIEAEPVVFNSETEAINAIATGQVDMALATPPGYYGHQREGTIKAIATFYPDSVETEFGSVTPVKELGTAIEFLGMDFFAVRSDVPEDIKAILLEVINKVYADEEFISYMEELGYPIWNVNSDEVLDVIKTQEEEFSKYVKIIE